MSNIVRIEDAKTYVGPETDSEAADALLAYCQQLRTGLDAIGSNVMRLIDIVKEVRELQDDVFADLNCSGLPFPGEPSQDHHNKSNVSS